MTQTIRLIDQFGPFCANGELATKFLREYITPALSLGEITIDLDGIKSMNSSFSNALFANLVIQQGPTVLNRLSFVRCRPGVRLLIASALEMGMRKSCNKRGSALNARSYREKAIY